MKFDPSLLPSRYESDHPTRHYFSHQLVACSMHRRAICYKLLLTSPLLFTAVILENGMVRAILMIYGAGEKASFILHQTEGVWV